MSAMRMVRLAAGALAVIGALNWGLVAIAEFDLVAWVFGMDFGETNVATRIIYGLVGISGLVLAAALVKPATADSSMSYERSRSADDPSMSHAR